MDVDTRRQMAEATSATWQTAATNAQESVRVAIRQVAAVKSELEEAQQRPQHENRIDQVVGGCPEE